MNAAYHTTTTVLPGHRIEITAPDLPEGETVDVVVVPKPPRKGTEKTGPSIFDIIAGLKGHRLFRTPEEVDRYVNEERDSWDR
jgi:hypothetical protein